MKRLFTILILLLAALAAAAVPNDEALRMGVLAYRPKPQTLAQWQPVAAYLEKALGRRVELSVYDHAELTDAAAQRAVDVVFTTPNHFILLQHTAGVSAPLATLLTREGKHELSGYGGVILARADRADIRSLADLAGKRIAVVSTDAFGGFQMQAAELVEAGLPMPASERLRITGQPHDRVIEAVLEGRADAGFVRAGVIEAMVQEGRLDRRRIKIINRQNLPSFPYAVSTKLYPEWPVVVMPQMDEKTASRLAAALFLLPRDHLGGVAGFTTPANYAGVENLMRSLRLPPFEQAPDIRLRDLWRRYAAWIVALGGLVLLLAAASTGLVALYRRSRQSEAVLREREEFLSSVVENIPDMIFVKEARELRFVRFNKAGEALLGYGREDMLGKNDHDFFPKEQADFFTGKDRQVLESGKPSDILEEVIATRAGQRTLHTKKIPILDRRGSPAYLLGISEDITERKRNDAVNAARLHLVQFSLTHSLPELLEETLNEAEKLTGSCIGFYHFVEDDQQSLTLQAWSTRTKAEFCKAEGAGLHYPISSAGVWTDCVRARKAVIHNDYASLPNRKGMPEGHAVVVRELVAPVFRGDNISAILGVGNKATDYDAKDIETVTLIAGLAWEIVERLRAEEAQRRLNRELRAISNCNQTLMRAEDEQALLNDICHIVCDDAGYRMAWVGYAEYDEGKSIRAVACAGVDEGFIEQAQLTWADTERGRGPSGTAIRSGSSVIVRDVQLEPGIGLWREAALRRGYHSSISLPLKDASGKTFGMLCIFAGRPNAFTPEEVRLLEELAGDMAFGITVLRNRIERRQAEAEILRLNRELEQRVAERTSQLEAANKELEAFSYSVSHDLRTPLRAIDGFSHILLEDYRDKLDDEGKRLLNVVRDNTNRMGQLIDDILRFSRAGRLEINVSGIDMEHLAHSVFEELQPSVAGSKLQLEIEHLPPVTGDSAMMRQVFVNLLSNAIKFSRTAETPEVLVGATVKEGEVVYYVKDNGVGFDMQYADKLFGVFQRLHSVNEFEGTGIGLAIVKRIITRHGGRVWAEGKPNEGATFYFSIPVTTAPSQKEAA